MRTYFFIVLCIHSFIVHSYGKLTYFGQAANADRLRIDDSTHFDLPVSEIGIGQTPDQDGYCIFQEVKSKIVTVQVPYTAHETYWGRCRGYYFKKCPYERAVQKTRMEHRLTNYTENIKKCCDGYAKAPNGTKCSPVCEHNCAYSNCTAPNVCTCYEGYEHQQDKPNVCVPKCDGCEHGSCIAPNLCYCNAGYDWDSDNLECVPVCSGQCNNGTCIAPEKCECNEGYKTIEPFDDCVPDCKESCEHGRCMSPDKCECDEGYQFVNGSSSVCEPICEMSCKNAKCTAPNVCECHHGYTVLDEDKPHECHCGKYCAEFDGMCHCLDESHRVSVDRMRNNFSSICSESNCENGFCFTPDECVCLEGFEKDDELRCVAVNETCIDDPILCNGTSAQPCSCINGVCTSNNTCVCVNGFKMSDDRNDVCEPDCSKECQNGFCIDPDMCECNFGYRNGYNESEWHICHPVCDPDIEDNNTCENGTCIAPGECKCFEGYEPSTEASFACKPMPFKAETQTSSLTAPIIGSLIAIVILVGLIAGSLFVFKQKRSKINHRQLPRDDEASKPITSELGEEL